MGKRIIGHDTDLTVRSDDYLLKDSATNNTKKITPEALKEYFTADVSASLTAEISARATAEGTIVANFASPYSTTTQYAVGDYCIKDLILYKCTSPTSGTWDSSKWTQVTALDLTSGVASDLADEIEARQSADETLQGEIDELPVDVKVDGVSVVDTNNVAQINNKANTTGTYDDLVVGTAQNLLSDSFTEDKVPYNFRQSFNGARLEDEIVGGTVAWNQLYNMSVTSNETVSDVTFTKNNGYINVNGTASANIYKRLQIDIPTVNGHKMLVSLVDSAISGLQCYDDNPTRQFTSVTTKNVFIANGNNIRFYVFIANNTQISDKKIYPQLIDLTQAFGSTIADYVYSLEQATAGSGIAWLKSYGFLTKDYYAYQSGKLESVNVASRKIVGKNLFDKSNANVFNGYIASGKVTANSNHRCIYIPCLPNTTYTAQKIAQASGDNERFAIGYTNELPASNVNCYDINSYTVSQIVVGNLLTLSITTGSDAKYIIVWVSTTTLYSASIDTLQIELGSTATTYEPYIKHTYPLDSDLTLRGIPKLDSSNNLYYDGDIYKSDGSVKRKYGVVDLGSLEWAYNSSRTLFVALISDGKATGINTGNGGGITAKYTTVIKTYGDMVSGEMSIGSNYSSSSTCALLIKDSAYTDAPTFKTAMNGVYLVYELATPTSETADAFINPQIVDARGTEEYVDYAESQGTRDVAIPVGHNSKYYLDIKGKVEQLYGIPEPPSTNGTYKLVCTVANGVKTYSWVSN